MHKHPALTESRIGQTVLRIRNVVYTAFAPINIEAHHVGGEPIAPETAFARQFQPFAVGQAWGPAWDTTWFRFSGRIPEDWRGREVVALIRLGYNYAVGEGFTAEGLVWQDGIPTRAINVHRADVPLARSARGGESFSFFVEAGANPKVDEGRAPEDESCQGIGKKPLFALEQAQIACFNREAYDLYLDFKVAHETMLTLPDNEPRRGQLRHALNTAVNLFDESDPKSFVEVRKALREVLGKRNGDTAHQISAVGHAHIDTAWLWPLRETIRKCARTFSTALTYMEEYPDYVFVCSQPQQYIWMKEHYPDIYRRIKKAIRRGQWEPIGSMWIEADCNLSSGESLVRQILHGKNFFQEEFGVDTKDLWLPDVFGYSAAMPQIMKKSGLRYFITQKISWSQFNKFPHHTFLWEGLDGTKIFTHFPPVDTYNADFTPGQLAYNVHNFKEHDRATRSLYIYGWGDGGGGPTKEMLETAKRVKDLEGLPRVRQEHLTDFLEKAERDAKDLPLWVGELYLETHRGTYTTQARTKKGNRKSEVLLHDAEFFDVVSGGVEPSAVTEGERAVHDVVRKNEHTTAAYLDRAWKLVLLNQFHDIIPGSSINWVYKDSAKDYATVAALCNSVINPARRALVQTINTRGFKQPVVVFNTSGLACDGVVNLPDGAPIYVQAPPCGYVVVEGSQESPVSSFAKPVDVMVTRGRISLDNGILQVVFDEKGFLASVYDHRAQREVLAAGARGNAFQLHKDYPNAADAWDVDLFYRETCQEITDLQKIEVVEKNELRATVRLVRKFGKSSITQNITLCAGSPRLDFQTEVNWQEEHRFLKVAFPVSVRSARATYEIQYGHMERPTHYNTSWDMARFEVCAQKWADLSEGDYGVALLNDCKHGYDILGNVMRLSLLRAPVSPDPLADLGLHQFTYSLVPHPGDFRQAQVISQAYALNNPLQVVRTDSHDGPLPKTQSYFQVDRAGVVIEAVKRAEKENAIIVRLYEAHGTRGPVTVSTSLPFKYAYTASMMERTQDRLEFVKGAVTLSLEPFEIVTLKYFV